jgi:hypothetical protein
MLNANAGGLVIIRSGDDAPQDGGHGTTAEKLMR